MRIVLVGFMGSGKSAVGRALAERLHLRWVDLDATVERTEGMSIQSIFASAGEGAFRDAEARGLEGLLAEQDLVLSTGGGVVERASNRALLKVCPPVVYLYAPATVLWERVSEAGARPLATDPEAFAALHARRAPLYEEVATVTVDATLPLSDVLAALQEALRAA